MDTMTEAEQAEIAKFEVEAGKMDRDALRLLKQDYDFIKARRSLSEREKLLAKIVDDNL